MGANLLLAPLWTKPNVELDWSAGLEVIDCLSIDTARRLAEAWPALDIDETDPDETVLLEAVTEYARGLVEEMRGHFDHYSRVLTSFPSPDGHWWLWVTGGMSWGDSPNELWEAIDFLWEFPEVLAAIGFHTTYKELETA